MTIQKVILRIADFSVSFCASLVAVGITQVGLYLIDQPFILGSGYGLGLIIGNTLIWGFVRPISREW